MSDTCCYHDQGKRVHEASATHVALGCVHGRGEVVWNVLDAITPGCTEVPEFCLAHAMDVAMARQAQQEQYRKGD